ncbi:MAG: alpha-glucosidase C-terminal domain-containing protein [Muribaculaceae bacterium]|nr:alpha-glucosidase C-terminal domain-containing protein [Muribaculaceae bacterium]
MKHFLLLLTLTLSLITTACNPNKNKAGDNDFKLPEVTDIAMYQVNPRVFAPQNSLNAVAERIDSIKALGVNVIWVMPIYPIGEVKSKNSPYSIKDYKAVAPEFGTIDDFKNLVKVCHEHGMAIILDWVANHTAWDNAWVKDHPEWYTQDKKGEIIFPENTDWTDVADLNYDNKEMRAAMIDAMKFWITEVGIDGFRCDVADAVPTDFWKDAITQLRKAAAPRNIVMLAEGNDKENFIKGGFDMNYAWDFKDAVIATFKGESAKKLLETDSAEYAGIPDGKVKLRFTTNHDEANKESPVVLFGNERGSMAAFVATSMLHGGLLVYSSQEVGYEKPINFFHYVPIDWTQHPELYKEYQQLIKVYNENAALRKGKMADAGTNDDVLLFTRTLDNDTFILAVNVHNKLVQLPTKDLAGTNVTDVMTGKDGTIIDKTTLKPYEYRIWKKK